MKTIEEWLETLPDGYRELALKNLKYEGSVASLATALGGAFDWDFSPEGYPFWRTVYEWAYTPVRFCLPALPGEADKLRAALDAVRLALPVAGLPDGCYDLSKERFDEIVKEALK